MSNPCSIEHDWVTHTYAEFPYYICMNCENWGKMIKGKIYLWWGA